MKDVDQKQIGLRIKSARVLTGLNQEEFATACNFNHTSVRNWEFGRVTLRKNAVMNLIDAFSKYGIQVSFDWLVYGAGEGPVLSSTAKAQALDESNVDDLVADFQQLLASKNNRILKAIVNEDSMRPLYQRGDLLLAIAQPLESLAPMLNTDGLPSPYLIKRADGLIVPRWLVSDGVNWWGRVQSEDLIEPVVSNWAGKIVVRIAGDIIETKRSEIDQELPELVI